MADEIAQRQGPTNKPIVNVMDGDEDLWTMRDRFQPNVSMVDVLDLLHVTPRLWDAAAGLPTRGERSFRANRHELDT
jgi:hypothetical protein